ncbi:hypothetical protein [Devosia sp. RR2S18]|uniref:hypothetical protein n=1 Tax=Devosia rhizosphaerae TaxID=3049774 RepID=UPI0025420D41|nr:hypothetical protein [Devosia sp. RR2S18]WIJ24221.1 hypothetical protein QOV41_14530 [Devosia sp. RR2S18]
MALSPAEKQRRYRERQAQAKKTERLTAGDSTADFLRTPFFEYLSQDGNWMNVEMNFDIMGLEAPSFEDDSGPKSTTGEIEETTYEGHAGSIGRAEIMVGQLLDAATELAGIINRYKRLEIAQRIAELQAADLSDPQRKKQALADVVRLNSLLSRLERQVRWPLPEWSVKEK